MTLDKLRPGQRARLTDGRVVMFSALIQGDVFARIVLGPDVETVPGKWFADLGELEIFNGTQNVEVVS